MAAEREREEVRFKENSKSGMKILEVQIPVFENVPAGTVDNVQIKRMRNKSSFHCADSPSKRFFMTFAGLPPTTVYGGTSLTTTDPAATTAPSPI